MFASHPFRARGPLWAAHLAVAPKTGIPKWLALVSGNMDQNLRSPSCLILGHTQISTRRTPRRLDSAKELALNYPPSPMAPTIPPSRKPPKQPEGTLRNPKEPQANVRNPKQTLNKQQGTPGTLRNSKEPQGRGAPRRSGPAAPPAAGTRF